MGIARHFCCEENKKATYIIEGQRERRGIKNMYFTVMCSALLQGKSTGTVPYRHVRQYSTFEQRKRGELM